jgi:hypothetical protein
LDGLIERFAAAASWGGLFAIVLFPAAVILSAALQTRNSERRLSAPGVAISALLAIPAVLGIASAGWSIAEGNKLGTAAYNGLVSFLEWFGFIGAFPILGIVSGVIMGKLLAALLSRL